MGRDFASSRFTGFAQESVYNFLHKSYIFNNLQEYINLRTMPLSAIVFRYVPLNSQLVTKVVTVFYYYLSINYGLFTNWITLFMAKI